MLNLCDVECIFCCSILTSIFFPLNPPFPPYYHHDLKPKNNIIINTQDVWLCQNLIELERMVSERTQILSKIEQELLLLCRSEKKKLYEQRSNVCCAWCCPSGGGSSSTGGGGTNDSSLENNWSGTAGGGPGGGGGGISSPSTCSPPPPPSNSLLSWQLCCECWRGGVDGTQERLSILYNQLEHLNHAIFNEQRRRRRVMKMLDRMEAVEGMKDIDYVLSSPFLTKTTRPTTTTKRNPTTMTHSNNHNNKYNPSSSSTTTTTTNPHNRTQPDEGMEQAVPNNNNTLGDQQQQQPASIPEEGEEDYSSHIQSMEQGAVAANAGEGVGGPMSSTLRSRSPSGHATPLTTTQAATSTDDNLNNKNNINNNDLEDPDNYTLNNNNNSTKGNTKRSKKTPPFLKAKHAIRRYSRVRREVSFLGRPIRSAATFGGVPPPIGGVDSMSSTVATSEPMEQHLNEVTDKAFVVMRTYTAATIAIQSMHSSKPGSMQVSTAPEPRDILWENIYVSKGAQRTRSYIGEFAVKMLVCFYIIPIATVALLVSESALVSSSPRLAQLDQASAIFSVAIATVQPMFIVGLQQLLPPLFVAIGQAEGRSSFSEVQMQAFSRYFLFQVLNVFLVTTIAGTIFDTIALIIEKPESAFEMLGNSLPRMSSFFITFVIMKTFLGLGMEMVRIVTMFQGIFRFLIFPNATLRTKRKVLFGLRAMDDPGWFPFHKVLAQDMLVVVISVVFAVVAPLVLLPCALFFLVSRVMWTHQHLYVYESVFESGGQFWPKIFRRFVFGLIIAQMTMTGQFILKEARHEAYATIALMFLTYFFLRSTRARYDPTSSTLPLEVATVMDMTLQQEEEARARKKQQKQHQQYYQRYQQQGSAEDDKVSGGYDNTRTDGMDPNNNKYNMTNDQSGDDKDETDDDDDEEDYEEPGRFIGRYDPFRKAYLQPALRANPKARPEQPFPPAQLGRENVFWGSGGGGGIVKAGGSLGPIDPASAVTGVDESNGLYYDSAASVRVLSLNQQERRLINRWWNDQLQRAGPQNTFMVLIGEECGTLTLSSSALDQYNNNNHSGYQQHHLDSSQSGTTTVLTESQSFV